MVFVQKQLIMDNRLQPNGKREFVLQTMELNH
jgi:hypothetical protein